MKRDKNYPLLILFIATIVSVALMSCSQRALHEAQSTVLQADSAWRASQPYSDSTQLAQAYKTLTHWQSIYPDEFVHACYHYGRLLRQHDNPVDAMQAFIDATHTRTHDYHILGRVYSNMGSICHLAGEFSLSYDMYKRSAEYFLQNGDSINYYYGINDMAFEMAEQGKKEETFKLLAKIETADISHDVQLKAFETKSLLYFNIGLYDSAYYYINAIQYSDLTSQMYNSLKAKIFWYLEQRDSALYYANFVLQSPCSHEQHKYNMYYILLNGDYTLSNEELIDISAKRSDIETDILIPFHNKMAVAMQLLEQDFEREIDLKWLYAVCITICIIALSICVYTYKKKRQYKLLSQQVTTMENINNETIQKHKQIIQKHCEYKNGLIEQLEKTCAIFYNSSNLRKDLCWSDYSKMCDIVNQQLFLFAEKLQNTHLLTEKEIRLCVLVVIGITNSKQLADMLYYGESGIRNFKNRTAKKLGTNSVNLRKELINIIIGELQEGTK